MSWPLYFRLQIGNHAWVAEGWRAGVVDVALLVVTLLTLRLLYQTMCFFLSRDTDG